jgi:hypothetical protein
MSYYNTTSLIGGNLLKEIKSAKTQEDKITIFFKSRALSYLTPSDILRAVFDSSTPLTSIRRALTNLTRDKVLVKTDKQKIGSFGKPVYCWRLNINL